MGIFINPNEIAGKRIVKQSNFLVDPCKLCGLYKGCESPKMKPFGDNARGILIVGEAPGANEDEQGRQFVGRSGQFLQEIFESYGYNFDHDCVRTNVQQCHVKGNEFDERSLEYCSSRLHQQILDAKPRLIFCFGNYAARQVLQNQNLPGLYSDAYGVIQGDIYPCRHYNTWVSIHYHPAYIMQYKQDFIPMFCDQIGKALEYLERPLPKLLIDDNNKLVEDLWSVLPQNFDLVSVDIETNQLSPFLGTPKILSLSVSLETSVGYVVTLDTEEKVDMVRGFLVSPFPKTLQNGKFDDLWCRTVLGVPIENIVWDTSLAQHLLDERKNKTNLDYMSYALTGETYKGMIDVKNMEDEFVKNKEAAVKYTSLDARFTLGVTDDQIPRIENEHLMEPMDLLLAGSKVSTAMECRGIKIDLKAFQDFANEIKGELEASQISLDEHELTKIFYDKKHSKLNYNSSEELRYLFFKLLKLKPITATPGGLGQINKEFLKEYQDDPEVGEYIQLLQNYKECNKVITTYLPSIEKYVDKNGFIHPTYNLNLVETYRSSCENPNMQNVPKRDERMRSFRRVFIPRHDYLVEVDFKGAEVCALAMMSRDRELIAQLNAGFDTHRYWASKLYGIPEEQVTKAQRQNAKNCFVFPEFYGAWYKSCAKDLNMPEEYVRGIEEEFWNMYRGVHSWQECKLEEYEKFGYVTNALGFRRRAPLGRNQIINTPIQGTSFLGFLLDGLIRMEDEFTKCVLESCSILQVHDSILIDVVHEEEETVFEIVTEVCTKKHFDWAQGVPLFVEYTIGKNWLEMQEYGSLYDFIEDEW